MGYDPATLDPYLGDKRASGTAPDPNPSTLAAVKALGFADQAGQIVVEDKRPEPPPATQEEKDANLRVYGLDVFARSTSEFDPVISGALPASYTLGPGDELVLVITGDVELLHTLPVTREGFVIVPQVGQISVNGLTLAGLRQQLGVRLGRVYSGINQGTTKFDISITRTRTNQVFVTGDVTRPGSYTASPLASVLNVLYQAGGPTGNGSFRNIQVVRGGNVVASVDLYKYLLTGNNVTDLHLETGDVIFVPVHDRHVAVKGEIARPAIYEIKQGETFGELLAFAGGLSAPAHTRHARITRIVPPEQRRDPGIDRVAMDVELGRALRDPTSAPTLQPGDVVEVFGVRSEVRQKVFVDGSVWRPGAYALRPGMRAWDLVNVADGLTRTPTRGMVRLRALIRATVRSAQSLSRWTRNHQSE
jgi:protein involved in polysaccharide export with SLBB domain